MLDDDVVEVDLLVERRRGRHTAAAQGTSYAVFAVLVLTVFAWLPQAALLMGAVVGALVGYNGHRLFAFAPRGMR